MKAILLLAFILARATTAVVERLPESLRPGAAITPFAITSVQSPGCSPMALAVMRRDATGDIDARLGGFGTDHALTPRQLEFFFAHARGYANETIAWRTGVPWHGRGARSILALQDGHRFARRARRPTLDALSDIAHADLIERARPTARATHARDTRRVPPGRTAGRR